MFGLDYQALTVFSQDLDLDLDLDLGYFAASAFGTEASEKSRQNWHRLIAIALCSVLRFTPFIKRLEFIRFDSRVSPY